MNEMRRLKWTTIMLLAPLRQQYHLYTVNLVQMEKMLTKAMVVCVTVNKLCFKRFKKGSLACVVMWVSKVLSSHTHTHRKVVCVKAFYHRGPWGNINVHSKNWHFNRNILLTETQYCTRHIVPWSKQNAIIKVLYIQHLLVQDLSWKCELWMLGYESTDWGFHLHLHPLPVTHWFISDDLHWLLV